LSVTYDITEIERWMIDEAIVNKRPYASKINTDNNENVETMIRMCNYRFSLKHVDQRKLN